MSTILVKILHRIHELFDDVVAAIDSILLFPSIFQNSRRRRRTRLSQETSNLNDFGNEVHRLFLSSLTTGNMASMSEKIREQFRSCLESSPVCMLPSYTHALPSGSENGTYLALDVGGSTFRVALISLYGREKAMDILHVSSSPIDSHVRSLEGTLFFDWMAEKIEATLREAGDDHGRGDEPLAMGLSWSFPIDQTSVRSGRVIHMGKGFLCSNGTLGQDLGDLIMKACRKRNLNIQVEAIVNDSSATLLSQAYTNPDTRMSLILGTGTNVAIHFPVHGIGAGKFGVRPQDWFNRATHVVVNSEMSMFGGGILPMTRWDDHINRTHLRPNYQPLEYMTTGQYLGEIVRLIIVEAVDKAYLFGGELPHSMREPYSLDTSVLAFIEADTSPSLSSSAAFLQKEHIFARSPSLEDLQFLQRISRVVSRRAAGYLATSIHSMWCLRNDVEFPATCTSVSSVKDAKEVTVVESERQSRNLSIACDGSVINKYPGFKDRCQAYLDQLTKDIDSTLSSQDSTVSSHIRLELAPESGILGAAVAVAVAVAEKQSEIAVITVP